MVRRRLLVSQGLERLDTRVSALGRGHLRLALVLEAIEQGRRVKVTSMQNLQGLFLPFDHGLEQILLSLSRVLDLGDVLCLF